MDIAHNAALERRDDRPGHLAMPTLHTMKSYDDQRPKNSTCSRTLSHCQEHSMKIGYCTWGMPTVPVDTILPFLAELGYAGVELTVIPGYSTEISTLDAAERRRIARMLKDYHLELPSIAS